MKDSPTRRILRRTFRVMAYRPPHISVPPQGVVLADVTIANPGQERQPLGRPSSSALTRLGCMAMKREL